MSQAHNIFHYMRNKNIKAVLFDMDGTLFDSEVGSIQMMKDLVKQHHNIEFTASFEELTGLGYPDKLKKILGFEDTELLNIVLKEGSRIYAEISEPIAGVNDCLNKLKQHGLKLAVCTNGDINLAKPVFEKVDIEMDLYQGSGNGINKKPEPDVYLAALKHFNLKPQEVLVVEDSSSGINAALNAKIPSDNILVFDPKELHNNVEVKFNCWKSFGQDNRLEPRNK